MILDEKSPAVVEEGESIIRQIKDIVSARIVTDDEGNIMEIHVLSGSGRSPKQIVRDIESAFMAQFGISLDHKKISVAQIQDDDTPGASEGETRPRISGIHLSTIDRLTEAKVQLQVGTNAVEGNASGPSSASNKIRIIAMATINALEEYMAGICNFVVEDITTVTIAKRQAVVVSVSLITNLGEQSLIGTAFVQNDDREATVKATLSAVNRKLTLMLND